MWRFKCRLFCLPLQMNKVNMHMNKKLSIGERLDAIKELDGIQSDTELAGKLGISKQRIYNWRVRDTWDVSTILAAFPAIRKSWVESGEGDMSDHGTQLTLKVKALEELIAEKDDIIEKQAKHIKRLTTKLTDQL